MNFSGARKAKVGKLWVCVSAYGDSEEEVGEQMPEVDLLMKLLNGLATLEDVTLYAKMLNGPTLDERFNREPPVVPCPCKGKFG